VRARIQPLFHYTGRDEMPNSIPPALLDERRIARTALALAAFWVLLIAASAGWQWYDIRRNTLAHATTEARSSYEKDLLYRRWATSHGGVYVPSTTTTPPNPYLDVPNRDVTTTTGLQLTLMNPAYMTREVHELGGQTLGLRGHITSLRPIRPANAADPWEREALTGFEHGSKEATTVTTVGGALYLRFMKPMMTERGCLRCHAKDGYREGDIRGGISVSVPLEPYRAVELRQAWVVGSTHLVVASIGLVGIWLGRRRLILYLGSRQRIAEALQASEERYRRVVELSPDAVFVHVDRRIVFANEACARMFGVDRADEVLGFSFDEMVHPDDRRHVAERVARILEKGEKQTPTQVRLVRGDGSEIVIESIGARVPYSGSTAVLVVARDVTERLRVDARLRQAQKMDAIGSLAGGIAHDFNNILTAMTMQLGLLRSSEGLSEEVAAGLVDLDAGANRAASLTRQLLMFSRQSVMQAVSLDLGSLFEETLSMLRRLIGEHITLQFSRDAALPLVNGDPAMLEQVLMNLVVNARDAMPGGGTVTVRVEAVRFDSTAAATQPERREGAFACLVVADTGCGMDEDTTRRAFDPFFTTKEPGRGTGLGLATVDGVVRQHRGWVEVSSTPAAGTTFRVYLPEAEAGTGGRAPVPADRRVAQPHALVPGTGRILLVEDDEGVRRLASRVLRASGYEVVEAGNGVEAVAEWARLDGQFDLLFTDMVMPEGMSGAQLAERLRTEKPTLRVLITSGYSADMAQVGAPHEQGIRYLAKPYHLRDLGAVVGECLRAGGPVIFP
jgi:PAS domain S-box-containing protein